MPPSKMKILALPLARIGPPGTKPLIDFHTFVPPLSSQPPHSSSASPKSRFRLLLEEKLKLVPNAPMVLQATTKMTDLWNELGHAEKSSLKFKAHRFGEREMDRIEFEEWSLKGLERGLVPVGLLKAKEVDNKVGDKATGESISPSASREIVSLLYPKLEPPIDPKEALSAFLAARKPFHHRRMILFILSSPLTIPFGLVPILPNFAFLFVAWRAWSHWKARNAAEILEQLLTSGRIEPSPSRLLDQVYAQTKPRSVGAGEIYLTDEMVKRIVQSEGLGETGRDELMRAVGQAQLRLDKALKEKTDSSPSTVGEKVEETKKGLEERTSPRREAEKGKTK